jgi:hypothetical protein
MHRPARLTASLLARKGEASPASGRGTGAALTPPLETFRRPAASRPVLESKGTLRLLAGGAAGRAFGDNAADADQRVTLTVRLDHARHRRLKILAARRRRTSQALLVEALDAYLHECGADCACLRGEPARCERN